MRESVPKNASQNLSPSSHQRLQTDARFGRILNFPEIKVRAEIHQALLSQFSIKEFFFEKVLVKD